MLISVEDALRLKEELLSVLDEDASNQERLFDRLDAVRNESGVESHSALMLILTGQGFEEEDARKHWEAILSHRGAMGERIGRDVGLRVAALDYFVNINRRVRQPRLIDLSMSDPVEPGAVNDPTTGLANLRMFRMSAQKEVRRARRYGPGFVMARIDIDDFETVTTGIGPLVSDVLVREAAMVISNKIRDIDVAARTAHGEFGLMLTEADRMGGFLVCERIRREIERFFRSREAGGRPADLTISAGLVNYPEDGVGPEDLWEKAGQALYLAKSRGKNNVAVFQSEKRHFMRFDAHGRGLQIRVSQDEDVSDTTAAQSATNVSRGGMLFESARPFELSRKVVLDLCEPDGTEAIRVRAQVVRIEDLAPGAESPRFEIGVVFHFDWEHEEQDFLTFFERWSGTGLDG